MLPVVNLWLVAVVVLALAGTWYTLVQSQLWERFALEGSQLDQRGGNNPEVVSLFLAGTRALVPAVEPLLGLALLLALFKKRGRLDLFSRVCGVAFALWVLSRSLPYDLRYLLPFGPLIAGACVASWGALRPSITFCISAGTTFLCILLSTWPSTGARVGPGLAEGHAHLLGAVERIPPLFVNLPVATRDTHPSLLDPTGTEALLQAVQAACDLPRCTAVYSPRIGRIQGRALTAILAFRGIWISVEEPPGADGDTGVLMIVPARPPQVGGADPPIAAPLPQPRQDDRVWPIPVLQDGASFEVRARARP